jgi:hypothetical protein
MTFPSYGQGYQSSPLPVAPAPRRHSAPFFITLGVLGAVALVSVLIMLNRQYLVDQWSVWTYDTNPTVESYMDRSTMTDHGEFLFKASHPDVAAADEFNSVCSNLEAGSGVLGCYLNDSKTITLFDITDERLDGMEEVVASHEMLHAAWDRMSEDEHSRISTMLQAEEVKLAGDADFVARMELYDRTEPGEHFNELHSIIGTEVPDLAPALEQYYAQYFSDRAALVALHKQSIVVFEQIQTQSAALVAELDALNASISADGLVYNSGYDKLNADIEDFNRRADAGEFESQEQFDHERAALLARQADLDALLVSIKAREAQWDAKHAELEALNAQAAALNTAINIAPRTTEGG